MSRVGERIGHYQVAAKLGEGGMGEVWSATDTRLGRQVAIKLLPEAKERRLIWLAHVEELDHASIAATLGARVASVRVMLHRARRRLAQLLQRDTLDRRERTDPTCVRAAELAAAAARRALAAEELAHAGACDACATELAIVASRQLARGLLAAARLPNARQTLLRARLEARRLETERRLRPLAVWHSVVLVLAAAVTAWLAPSLVSAFAKAPEAAGAAILPLVLLASGVGWLAVLSNASRPGRRVRS